MEIAVTVPYEIKIDAEGINLDNFECFFAIFKDSISYVIKLQKKQEYYILKVPKELSFLSGTDLKYEIQVKKENAVFTASEGEINIIGILPSQFKVEIKQSGESGEIKKELNKEEKKPEKVESKKPNTKEEGDKEAVNKKEVENKSEDTKVKKDVSENSPEPTKKKSNFSFLREMTGSKTYDPDDPNNRIRKILEQLKVKS